MKRIPTMIDEKYQIQKQAFDIPTFCRVYSIGRSLAYAEIKAGRLKIAKVGRRTVIPAEAADNWLKQKMDVGE